MQCFTIQIFRHSRWLDSTIRSSARDQFRRKQTWKFARLSELLSCRRIGFRFFGCVAHLLSLTITRLLLILSYHLRKSLQRPENFPRNLFSCSRNPFLKDLCLKDLSLCVPHFKPKTSLQWFVSKRTLRKVSQPARCAMDSATARQLVRCEV